MTYYCETLDCSFSLLDEFTALEQLLGSVAADEHDTVIMNTEGVERIGRGLL
jgi:hypothetical protein